MATWPRWAAGSALVGAASGAAVKAFLALAHASRAFASLGWLVGLACAIGAILVFAALRAEEARLARELRTARAGTAVLRSLVMRRREKLPLLVRAFSTGAGAAAVLLAGGDRSAALDVLRRDSPLMAGGRLEKLRAVIDCDLERATGTSVGLERCVQRLRAMAPVGHREADLYRNHVLTKAVLEQGDAETGLELARGLARSPDDEERVCATWLRVWFDLDVSGDEWPALDEGDLRMATLAARSHGAERLVDRLEAALGAIAPQRP